MRPELAGGVLAGVLGAQLVEELLRGALGLRLQPDHDRWPDKRERVLASAPMPIPFWTALMSWAYFTRLSCDGESAKKRFEVGIPVSGRVQMFTSDEAREMALNRPQLV